MDVKQLLKAVGQRQQDIATVLKVSGPTMSRWIKNGIPAERVVEVARATGIPASKLRPDLAAAFAEVGANQPPKVAA